MAGPSDDRLMALGAGGDEDAFRVLVERWQRPVVAFLWRMLGSREEAEDLCQETFMRVCEQAPRYRPAGQFRSWLFRIAGNLARSRLRRRRLVRWLPFDLASQDRPAPGAGPDQRLEDDERRVAIRAALARLPDRQRQAIVLRYDQELSYREIADVLETTVSAVETLLYRATRGLRSQLHLDERLDG